MSDQDVRRQILDLLSEGRLDADQATELLRLIGTISSDTQNAQARIVGMLADDQISLEQTTELLKSLASGRRRKVVGIPAVPSVPPVPSVSVGRKGIARVLRINIDASDEDGSDKAKIRVNVPIALAKFASKFMPSEAKEQLDAQGINLVELLETLGDDLPEGRLVDIDASDGDGAKIAKIIIEVV